MERGELVRRVTAPEFGPEVMPEWLDARFRGEWALVTLSMAAVAVANVSTAAPSPDGDHLAQLEALANKILTPALRAFDRDAWGEDPIEGLDGPKGHAGFLGHAGLVLGLCRLAGGCPKMADLHRGIIRGILRRLSASEAPLVETYPGETYVPDNAVLLAAIAVHDRVEGTPRAQLRAAWRAHAEARLLDAGTGVMVFAADETGAGVGSARGSGAAWTLFYLYQFDRDLADQQFEKFRQHFTVPWLLGKAVLEYPAGRTGTGDVDSGPALFGLSPSGTAFGIGAARLAGDVALSEALDRTTRLGLQVVDAVADRGVLAAPILMEAILLAQRTAVPWAPRGTELTTP